MAPGRTPATGDAARLSALRDMLAGLVERVRALLMPVDESVDRVGITAAAAEAAKGSAHPHTMKTTGASEESGRLLYNTTINTHVPSRAEEKGTGGNPSHGLIYLRGRDVALAAPETWGMTPVQFDWRRLASAAEAQLPALGVAPAAWHEACAIMGREAASVALLVLDANRGRREKPVRNVGGALRAMTRRAETGILRLHASVYGINARRQQQQPEG